MIRTTRFAASIITLFLTANLSSMLHAQTNYPPSSSSIGIDGVSGDMPLTTLDSFEGNIDVTVAVIPHTGTNPSGTFSLTSIPAGATILKAWFITTSFGSAATETATVVFGTTTLPSKTADVTDPGSVNCREYRFDVTSLIAGNGSYPYTVRGTSAVFGDALVVVYEHSNLPLKKVVINDGAESLQNGTSTTSLAGFATGAGRLIVFTESDNEGGTGEALALNGTTVLGPGAVFTANMGPYASLIDVPVTLSPAMNTVAVTTGTDWLGLHLAILTGTPGTPPTLSSIRPTSGVPGKNPYVRLEGTSLIVGGTNVHVSGTGVTVSAINVGDNPSTTASLVARLAIDPGAALGPRDITVSTTGGTSNAMTFTVRAPEQQCAVSLPVSANASRGTITVNTGLETSRQISGTWVAGWMIFNAKSVTFRGISLLSGTVPPTSPAMMRSLSGNVPLLQPVAVLNGFYDPYLCAYSVIWASSFLSLSPYQTVSRETIDFLNNLSLEDFDGKTREIPR